MNYDQFGDQHVSRRKPSRLKNVRSSPSSFDTVFAQKVERRPTRAYTGIKIRIKTEKHRKNRSDRKPRTVDTTPLHDPETGSLGFRLPRVSLKSLFVIVLVLAVGVVAMNWDSIEGGFTFPELSPLTLQDPVGYQIIDSRYEPIGFRRQEPSPAAVEVPDFEYDDISLNLTETFQWFNHRVRRGESVSTIAAHYSLNQGSIISLNKLKTAWHINTGSLLKIPNMDGINYTVQRNDSISSIAAKLKVPQNAILDANDIRNEILYPGQELFIPGALMDSRELQSSTERPRPPEKPMLRPVPGRITSTYGWRVDPVNPRQGEMRYHRAVDFAGRIGDPVRAAMSGTVLHIDRDRNLGNFIILKHDRYQTLYAHLSETLVKPGDTVNQGTTIGRVGNTGYTTGPHLHFEVFQNGNRINPLDLIR